MNCNSVKSLKMLHFIFVQCNFNLSEQSLSLIVLKCFCSTKWVVISTFNLLDDEHWNHQTICKHKCIHHLWLSPGPCHNCSYLAPGQCTLIYALYVFLWLCLQWGALRCRPAKCRNGSSGSTLSVCGGTDSVHLGAAARLWGRRDREGVYRQPGQPGGLPLPFSLQRGHQQEDRALVSMHTDWTSISNTTSLSFGLSFALSHSLFFSLSRGSLIFSYVHNRQTLIKCLCWQQ